MFFQEYEKLRKMGEGGFATVYKVRHARLGYVRALKVCNHVIDDESDPAWQTFLSECKVLLRIGNGSHPNIVRIYQPRLLDNHAVVEMDCVEGEPLTSYVRDNRFIPIDEFLRFARQIIGAVAYCHVDVYRFLMDPKEDGLELDPEDGRKYLVSPAKEQELVKKYGVVHNDLHSGNIIRRDYDGQYILLDFGLAIQNAHCVKSSSRFDGAIEYCSPEKLDRGEISTQSDVYALGVLLYEVLAGRVPFPYANGDGSGPEFARSRVYQQHLHETPPSIYEIRKEAFESTHPGEAYRRDYPEELEALIMKCLEKEPKNRYENGKVLLEAFESLPNQAAEPKLQTMVQALVKDNGEAVKPAGKKSVWGYWVAIALLAAATIAAAYLSIDMKKQYNRQCSQNSTLIRRYEDAAEKMRSQYEVATEEIENFKSRVSSLSQEKDSVEKELLTFKTQVGNAYPLIISDIEIANVYKGGNIETDYGNTLYSSNTMYLTPRIKYYGMSSGTKTLKVKWFKPDGSMSTGSSSPYGFSQSNSYDIYPGAGNSIALSGWGNENKGHWRSGSYRIEIWYENTCLKSKTFRIY